MNAGHRPGLHNDQTRPTHLWRVGAVRPIRDENKPASRSCSPTWSRPPDPAPPNRTSATPGRAGHRSLTGTAATAWPSGCTRAPSECRARPPQVVSEDDLTTVKPE